ncbi:hypothetical protein ACTFIW_012095 [Dictyostelium discoideum]
MSINKQPHLSNYHKNFLDCCSPRKLTGLKGKLIALNDTVIPFKHYTRRTKKFHSQCLTLANGLGSFPIHQDFKSESEQLQAEDSNQQHNHSLICQSPEWSNTRYISSVRKTLETMPQEESQLDWTAYSNILQCKNRPPQPSFRDEPQIIVQKGSVKSNTTLILSKPYGSVRISPEPSNQESDC